MKIDTVYFIFTELLCLFPQIHCCFFKSTVVTSNPLCNTVPQILCDNLYQHSLEHIAFSVKSHLRCTERGITTGC